MKSPSQMQTCLRLLACATLFVALLNVLNALSVCRAHERVNVGGDCEIVCKAQPAIESSKDTDLDESGTVRQSENEIQWTKVYEPAGTPVDEVSGNDWQKSNRDFTGETSVSEKRVFGSVALVGDSLLSFLENDFPTTAVGHLSHTGSEKPSGDFAEQTLVSGERLLGSVVAVGESLMPSLKIPVSPEEVMDVAQRVEHPEQTVSVGQNPVLKTELNELESRLCQEISGIIKQLTLDIGGVKQVLGRVEETVPTKEMGEEVNQRLGRIEDSFLRVSDLVGHIDSTTPEIESLEAHFTQLREQVASAQAELHRNSQGVVEIGGAFGTRLDELEGILHRVIAKWDSDQSDLAQRFSHLQDFQPDQLNDFNERLGRIEDSFLKVSDQVRHIDLTTPEIESLEAHFTQLREQVASAQAELDRNNQGVAEIGGAFGSRLDDLEGILQGVIGKWDSEQSELAQRLSHLQDFQPDQLNDFNERLGRIEDSFLKVSDQVRHIDSTTPEIESLEAHFTQLRDQVASAQAELDRNSQGVVAIGGAFGSRLDDLEGILQELIDKWESDQSELAQRLSQLQGFQSDELNNFNERLGRIEDSFLKVSDQVRHIDSTTPAIESLEAHFTQLRDQVASAQAELHRNSQGVAKIGGVFGGRLDELEGILKQVIARWDSDQLEMTQRLSHLQGFQPDQLNGVNERLGSIEDSFLKLSDQMRHINSTAPATKNLEGHFMQLREQVASAQAELHRNSQGVAAEISGTFGSRLDELEKILHEVVSKWDNDQSEMTQRLSHLQGLQPDQLNGVNERLGRIEDSFLKLSDQMRYIDSTNPAPRSLEGHFTQLREQVASAQAELHRNSQGVAAEISGTFGSRLDELEGILQKLIAKWESDQLKMAQKLSQLQGFHPGGRNTFNQQVRHLEAMERITDSPHHTGVLYRTSGLDQTLHGRPTVISQRQVTPVKEPGNIFPMIMIVLKSCVVGVLFTCMVVLALFMFFLLLKKSISTEHSKAAAVNEHQHAQKSRKTLAKDRQGSGFCMP